MSAEDSDSSVIEISDFESDNDGDDASVVLSDGSDTEESSGFFSDEESELDENWNKNSANEGRGRRTMNMSSSGFLEGKCALCSNLKEVSEAELEERCLCPSAEPWCKCGKCSVVSYHMKKYDRICCHELSGVFDLMMSESGEEESPDTFSCITLHPKFEEFVLESGSLYTSVSSSLDKVKLKKKGGKYRASNANSAFVRWIWNRLGYGDRIMPPACVIARIRQVHMKSAPVWYYHNFMPGKYRCEYGKHCVAAAADTYNIK